MKKAPRNLLIILGIILVLAAGITVSVKLTKNWINTVAWDNPKLDQLPDGAYPGESQLQLPPGTAAATSGVQVMVHIKDHRYAKIETVNPTTIAQAMESLGQTILERQSLALDTDAIAGGTVTKVAFLSAVSNAVKNALAKSTVQN